MLYILEIIIIVFLWSKINKLGKRLNYIESKLQETNEQMVSASKNEEEFFVETEKLQQPKEIINNKHKLDPLVLFTSWFKENWMLKVGVLLILVGFGWFMSYAFINNWIGPVGRVTLGFVVGTILTLFGSSRMSKNMTQGKLFLILGSTLVIITSYSARVIYDFFNPVAALGIVFLVSVYVAVTALQLQRKEIAIYGLITAFLAPILTDGVVDTKLLFTYLIIVSLSSIWLASIKGWRIINSIAIIGFGLFSLPYIIGIIPLNALDEGFVLLTVFGLGFVYFMVSVIGAIKNDDIDSNSIIVAILDSALIILVTYQMIVPELQSIVLAVWMIIFAIGSYVAFNNTGKEKFFYVYSLVAVLMLAIATSMQLDGNSLFYAYAFESTIISVAGYIITRKLKVGYYLSFLIIGPMLMALPAFFSSYLWRDGMFNESFMILLLIGILSCGLGWFYRQVSQEAETRGIDVGVKYYIALTTVGSLFLLALIWRSADAEIVGGGAITLSLIIYTVIGIITYFSGLLRNINALKYYGAVLTILVIIRLVLIDVWSMDLPIRVVTFVLIGILFISTSFIVKNTKKEDHLIADEM